MTLVSLVTHPTAAEEVKASVVKLLRNALELAETGEIESVVLILGHTSGEWTDQVSETVKFSEAVGRLEITKQEWINQFLRERG